MKHNTLSPQLSKRLRKLKMKHIMNWEEIDKKKVESSLFYSYIKELSEAPISFQLTVLVATSVIAIQLLSLISEVLSK